jgi:hypothetical protein
LFSSKHSIESTTDFADFPATLPRPITVRRRGAPAAIGITPSVGAEKTGSTPDIDEVGEAEADRGSLTRQPK